MTYFSPLLLVRNLIQILVCTATHISGTRQEEFSLGINIFRPYLRFLVKSKKFSAGLTESIGKLFQWCLKLLLPNRSETFYNLEANFIILRQKCFLSDCFNKRPFQYRRHFNGQKDQYNIIKTTYLKFSLLKNVSF